MPYTIDTLPKATKSLPLHAKKAFLATFNSVLKDSGDETKAFRIAWYSAKKARKKKTQDNGDTPMSKSLSAHYLDLINQVCSLDQEIDTSQFETIKTSLQQEPDSEESLGELTTSLEQAFYRSYGDYLRVPSAHFKGSLEERFEVLCYEMKEQGIVGKWGFLVSIFPDYVIACDPGDDACYYYSNSDHPTYWKIPYTLNEDNTEVTWGEREEVGLEMVIVPAHEEPDDDEMHEQSNLDQAAMKTDGGKKYSSSAYLIVGDPKLPKTWKLRIEEEPGKVTVAQLGRAHAALTKGFRGNKVKGNSEDKAKAMRKLRSLYKKHGGVFPGAAMKQDEDIPEWVLQGQDPPGGTTVLTQSQTVLLQAESYDEATGILKVKGTATTADVISAKKQVYPLQVWQDNLPRMQRLIEQGKLVGEIQHPVDGRPSLDRTCIKYTKVWQDGNEIKFEADILPTEPLGKNLQTLIQNGVAVDISSRGAGEFKTGTWNGTPGISIVQRGFRNDAFDAVVSGASPGSHITDWQMQSATNSEDMEEEMSKELLEKIAASVEALAANQKNQDEKIAALAQAKEVETPKVDDANQSKSDPEKERIQKSLCEIDRILVSNRIESLFQETKEKNKWGPQWLNLYRKQLVNANCANVEELEQAATRAHEIVSQLLQEAPQFPGMGFTVQKDVGERGFKNGRELIEDLISDLPDDIPGLGDGMKHFMQQDADGKPIVPGWFQTPRRQMRKILQNIAQHSDETWNGHAAIQGLVRLSQGYNPQWVQENVLDQACADGTTALGAGGAPASAVFIFPLVRRVFPQLIVTEIASVQPMDRPDGRIFYLDIYRKTTGFDTVDPAGTTVSDRTRMDRSDSFSDSYANDPGECNTPNFMQMRLASVSVAAATKKLTSNWTIEETQDLRAYHGLDASLEIVGGMSREIALEWNQEVLKGLLNNATAGNENYGTVAPSGYSQKEWDEYITRYIEKASNDIFKKRNGDLTHIIAGPDAWLKLAATHRIGVNSMVGVNPEQYSGLTLVPFMGVSMPNVKTFKTSFWAGVNTNKILCIRKGADWSDTPYVWAPYIDYVSPVLTTPGTFVQSQGVMSRAAHRVVVSDAIATITVNSGVTGVAL